MLERLFGGFFKDAPNEWTLKSLGEHCNDQTESQQFPDGRWGPARPIGFFGRPRWRLAWAVLKGEADALYWKID